MKKLLAFAMIVISSGLGGIAIVSRLVFNISIFNEKYNEDLCDAFLLVIWFVVVVVSILELGRRPAAVSDRFTTEEIKTLQMIRDKCVVRQMYYEATQLKEAEKSIDRWIDQLNDELTLYKIEQSNK